VSGRRGTRAFPRFQLWGRSASPATRDRRRLRAEGAERERVQVAQEFVADVADGDPGADRAASDDGALASVCRQGTRYIGRCVAEYLLC
jgi:hypothetical protein